MSKAIALARHHAPAAEATARSIAVIGCAVALALAEQFYPLIQIL